MTSRWPNGAPTPSAMIQAGWSVTANSVIEKAASFASVIRGYFDENPEWLDTPSNQAVLARYQNDPPGGEVPKRHKQGAAN